MVIELLPLRCMNRKLFLFIFSCLIASLSSLQAQQVNPFELKDKSTETSNSPVLESVTDTGDYSVIVVEDSLTQPTINRLEKIEEKAEEEAQKERNNNAYNLNETETQVSQKNPFELIQEPRQKESKLDTISDNILQDTLMTSDTIVSEIYNSVEEEESTLEIDVIPIPKERNLIVFFMSLLSGLLIAVSLQSKRNILVEIWKSLRNLSFMKLLQKEQKNGLSTPYIILYFVYLINISFFVRFLCINYEVALFGYSLYKIAFFLFTLIVLRHFSLYVLSFMRTRLNEILQYNFIITTINLIVGVLLIPINLLVAFSNDSLAKFALFFGIGILLTSFLTRWFRAFINSLRVIIGDSFHFLLYLCSCEIVPIIILVGYIRNIAG